MKNHYKVLGINKEAKNKEIKDIAKSLLTKIKNSSANETEKNKMKNQVHESYKFLTDYHSRKSLDEYLDKPNLNEKKYNYKISKKETGDITGSQQNDSFDIDDLFLMNIFPFTDISNLEENSNGSFYMKSYVSEIKPDKNGNYIEEIVETTNNNGKKEESKRKVKLETPKKINGFLNWHNI